MAGAPAPVDAANDPRWVRFNGPGLACSCGETHVGLISLSMLRPAGFPDTVQEEPDAALRTDGNFLSPGYCVWQGKFFAIRMSMPMTIQGAPPPALLLSVWASVDEPSFKAYVSAVNAGALNDKAQAQARLINRIGGFPDTFGILGAAFQQPNERPVFLALYGSDGKPSANPIVNEQRHGLTLDRLFEVYAANGHDMRSSF